MTERPRHRVSVKAALLNPSKDKALMTVLSDGRYGLPGGHVELDEQVDEALWRELREELNLMQHHISEVAKRDFWREEGGDRIILGYSGVLLDESAIKIDPEEIAGVIWASRDDIIKERISSDAYNDFVVSILQG